MPKSYRVDKKIQKIDPFGKEFEKLIENHKMEYYKKINQRLYSEIPEEFWDEFTQRISSEMDRFNRLVLSPASYTTPQGAWDMASYLTERNLQLQRGAREMWLDTFREMGVIPPPGGYRLGVDIAATPKNTVMTTDRLKLHRYLPAKAKVARTPVLVVYSYINGYYILDLKPGLSVVEGLVNQGLDVYITDWVPPKTLADRNATLDDYMGDILKAVDFIKDQTGQDQVGLLGYCIGGTMANIAAALRPDDISFLINLTTGIDTRVGEYGPGAFGAFTDLQLVDLDSYVRRNGGVFPGAYLKQFFGTVKPRKRAEQLIEEYLYGRIPPPDPVSFWNEESARDVPGPAHLAYLKALYNDNSLARGEMDVLGDRVDLKRIKVPYQNVLAYYDHIIPFPIGLKNSHLMGTPRKDQEVILVQGGHVRGVVNPGLFSHISGFARKHAGPMNRRPQP